METTFRTATAGDEDALYALLVEMHAENASEPISEHRVRARIRQCLDRGTVILAERGSRLAASIGLIVERHWWTEAEHLADAWIFVREQHRSTRTFFQLLDIGRHAAANMNLPFEPGLSSATDIERKDKVFSRLFRRKAFKYTTEE